MMTKEDEYLLWKQWRVTKDEEKLNQLFDAFQPLIKSAVTKYYSAPIPKESIELEAKRLFHKGLLTYNPKHGAKLNTHLYNQMKPLYRFVSQQQNIAYIPEVRIRQIGAFNVATEQLQTKLDRPPTAAEISEKMGIGLSEVTRLQKELRPESMEALDDFSTLYTSTSPKLDALHYVYHELSPKEKLVFEHLTGLTGRNIAKTSTEISNITHIPVTDVRKIRKNIANKLEPFKDLE